VIHFLNDNIIKLITAGEVIQDPLDIVKELLENSLDAQPTEINIYIYEGGIKKIIIEDNGSGMNESDLSICKLLHTTSKLIDLNNIVSYGFRGEALYSIDQVSTLTIESRVHEYGYRLLSDNTMEICSMNPGTRVIVENLFNNYPPRKKFLKTPYEYNSKIRKLIQKYKTIFPFINLFIDNKKQYIKVIKLDEVPIKFSGDFSWKLIENTPYSCVFVNNRPVKWSIDNNNYILAIFCSPHILDVNCHPRKLQVRFSQELPYFFTSFKEKQLEYKIPKKKFFLYKWGDTLFFDYKDKLYAVNKTKTIQEFVKNNLTKTKNINPIKISNIMRKPINFPHTYEKNIMIFDKIPYFYTFNNFIKIIDYGIQSDNKEPWFNILPKLKYQTIFNCALEYNTYTVLYL